LRIMTMKPTPYVYRGTVISNYDGDTLIAMLDLGMGIKMRAVCRLLGLDAPEIRGGSESSRAAAKAAKQRLQELVSAPEDSLVFHSTAKPDKYGRLLVSIWNGDMCVNDTLLVEGHARPYDGGTKQTFEEAP